MFPSLRIKLAIIAVLTAVIIVVDVIGDAILNSYGLQWARFPFRLGTGIIVTIICFIIIATWKPQLIQHSPTSSPLSELSDQY